MSQPGIGAMLHYLGGGSKEDPAKYAGRKITAARIDKDDGDGKVRLTFSDGARVAIYDDGRSCYESRYITTDDEIESLVGQNLVSITAQPGPETEEHGEPHETCFVIIQGDQSAVTLTTHNEHNGYYGGFGLTMTEEADGSDGPRRMKTDLQRERESLSDEDLAYLRRASIRDEAAASGFEDGWSKGRAEGRKDGILVAQDYYAEIAEQELQHCGDEGGEVWIVRRIVDLIRANRPPEADGGS